MCGGTAAAVGGGGAGAGCGRVTCLDVALFAAFIGLGLGSWISVNGIFQELPVVALSAPRDYNISVLYSYGSLLVAGANVYPVLYLLALSSVPGLKGNGPRKLCVDKWVLVIMMLLLGVGGCGLLAGFWHFTDEPGSAALFFFLVFQVRGTAAPVQLTKTTVIVGCVASGLALRSAASTRLARFSLTLRIS
jgi:hypothetical protein